MNKSYQLLEEFSFVKDRCPKGIYLIPVPRTLYNNSPTDTNNDRLSQNPSNVYLKDLTPYSKVPSWQGVIFIRNPQSPFSGGVFRFEISFLKHSQIRQWLQQAAGKSSVKTTNCRYSYNYYPIVHLTSEVHHLSNEQDRLAEFCLNDLWHKELEYSDAQLPFSRVLYVLKRLVAWFDGDGVAHQPQLAKVDTQLSKSDTLLYHTLKNDDSNDKQIPRLINFVQQDQPLRHQVLDILAPHRQRQ